MRNTLMMMFLLPTALTVPAQVLQPSDSAQNSEPERWCVVVPEPSRPLPQAVVRVIMDSNEAAFARELMREQGTDPYRSAPLDGVRVELATGRATYLVRGSGPMTGGDNRWYWLVEQSHDKARVLLHAGTGCVHIGTTSTNGYRDIQTEWQAAGYRIVREYRWNGSTYKLSREFRDDKVR